MEDEKDEAESGNVDIIRPLKSLHVSDEHRESFSSLGSSIAAVSHYSQLQHAQFRASSHADSELESVQSEVSGESEGEDDHGSFVSASSDVHHHPLMDDHGVRLTPVQDIDTVDSKAAPVASSPSSSSGNVMIRSPVVASLDVADRLNVDAFNSWCFVLVSLNFDLDIGQHIDFVYPPDVDLSESQRSNIRFSSFPDSSSAVGDTVFSFRFGAESAASSRLSPLGSDAASAAGSPLGDSDFLYGYVFFRQQRDASIRRGYLQRSLCLVSRLPFPGLFLRLVSILGPVFLDSMRSPSSEHGSSTGGKEVVEAAAHSIAKWPAPFSADILDLPFFGTLFQVEMPAVKSGCRPQLLQTSGFTTMSRRRNQGNLLDGKQRRPSTSHTGEQILPTIPCTLVFSKGFFSSSFDNASASKFDSMNCEIDLQSGITNTDLPGTSVGLLFRFFDVLDHLWTIWELVLFGEPLVVMGKSQTVVSEAVWWISQLIRPVPFCGDYRPYFTIQDSDFRRFTSLFKSDVSDTTSAESFYMFGTGFSATPRSTNTSANPSRTNLKSNAMSTPSSPKSAAYNAPSGGVYLTPKNLSTISLRGRLGPSGLTWPSEISEPRAALPKIDHSRSIILGVTNPFFSQAMEHWPNVLRLKGSPLTSAPPKNSKNGTSKWSTLGKSNNSSNKGDSDASGLFSSHKPFIARDRKLIKALQEAFQESTNINLYNSSTKDVSLSIQSFFSKGSSTNSSSSGDSNLVNSTLSNIVPSATSPTSRKRYKGYALNEILRRQFVDLTERFLVPLNRYFATLLPGTSSFPHTDTVQSFSFHGSLISFHAPPPPSIFKIMPFDTSAFLSQLSSNGPPRLVFNSANTGKSHWVDMYMRFLESPNFVGWLRDRKNVAEYEIRSQYLSQIRNLTHLADLDLFLILRRELYWLNDDPVSEIDNSGAPKGSLPRLTPQTFANMQLAGRECRLDIQVQAKMVWGRLSSEIKGAFKQGAFDQFVELPVSGEDDYIMVV